jgi:hypothetical protein
MGGGCYGFRVRVTWIAAGGFAVLLAANCGGMGNAPGLFGNSEAVSYSGGACLAGACSFSQHVSSCASECSGGRCGLIPISE